MQDKPLRNVPQMVRIPYSNPKLYLQDTMRSYMTVPLPISPHLRQSSRSVRLEKPLRRLRVDTGGHVLEFIICHSWVNMDSSV